MKYNTVIVLALFVRSRTAAGACVNAISLQRHRQKKNLRAAHTVPTLHHTCVAGNVLLLQNFVVSWEGSDRVQQSVRSISHFF